MLFAHLKRRLRLDVDCASVVQNGAKDEFLIAATAQNLRKLAKLIRLPAPALRHIRWRARNLPPSQRLQIQSAGRPNGGVLQQNRRQPDVAHRGLGHLTCADSALPWPPRERPQFAPTRRKCAG